MTDIRQEALRAQGAAQRDPLAWHYIQALAERAQRQPGPAQPLLLAKLELAMNRLQAKLDAAPSYARNGLSLTTPPGQVKTQPAASALATLLQNLRPGLAESPRIRQFSQQLSQLRVQKQVSQALAQAPQNAGPINSHMLVLRSLGLMRETSPEYLNRFMGYVDTLLWLDVAESVKPAVGKKVAAGKGQQSSR